MFLLLIVVITWVHTFLKTQGTIHLKCIHFIAYVGVKNNFISTFLSSWLIHPVKKKKKDRLTGEGQSKV